jgi:uncharacterized protein (TIGR02145 family)
MFRIRPVKCVVSNNHSTNQNFSRMKMPFLIVPVLFIGIILVSSSGCKKNKDSLQPGTVKDIDGNTYKTVKIGEQWWMAENLKTTKYKDGKPIPYVTDNASWAALTTGAYCWYDNNYNTYGSVYGALYNWLAVETGNLCPTGWHVPTDAELTILTDFLGGESIAGGSLKETGTAHWNSPNKEATNSSVFTALPGGSRDYDNGMFSGIGKYGYCWSSSAVSAINAWHRSLYYDRGNVGRSPYNKTYGRSVRCVKD